MGITSIIALQFLIGIIFILIGVLKKKKVVWLLGIILLMGSLGLAFMVWNALSFM
ncbi:hypothetical protein [Peribacillus alkalitolerans]|uniref:hypothetical protein n=1 Tax=Peribacillus alkalitolerans TaxID=1550385 RepID=UPI0013D432CD|nr:hypothetical protein [Peribacillus alkalitolerans]